MKFRYKALKRMREPDELDTPTQLAAPRGWVAVFVVMIVVVGAGVWAFLGELPRTINANGLITHPLGVTSVRSPHGGVLRDLAIKPGDTVRRGQVVARVTDANGTVRPIDAMFAGNVIDVIGTAGQVVTPGAPILTVERTDGEDDRLVAMLLVPTGQAAAIRKDAPVDLAVSTAPPGVYGLLRGRVTEVGRYRVPTAIVAERFGGERAAQALDAAPDSTLVIVDLTRDPGTPSGYAWTSRTGAPKPLDSQTLVVGTVTVGQQSPISFVLGR